MVVLDSKGRVLEHREVVRGLGVYVIETAPDGWRLYRLYQDPLRPQHKTPPELRRAFPDEDSAVAACTMILGGK